MTDYRGPGGLDDVPSGRPWSKTDLRRLWDKWQEAKRHYENVAMCGTSGKTPDGLFQLDVEYRLAMREMMRAEDAYVSVFRKLSGEEILS